MWLHKSCDSHLDFMNKNKHFDLSKSVQWVFIIICYRYYAIHSINQLILVSVLNNIWIQCNSNR